MINQQVKKYASTGIFIRISSGVVDFILAILLWYFIHQILVKNLIFSSWFIATADFLFLPAFFFYYIFCEWKFGKTVGKMLCRIKSVSTTNTRMGLASSILRSSFRLISIGLFFSGYLMIIFRRDKKALHDLISGTKVIYPRRNE